MVIPFGDENPRTCTPWVSWGWAAASVLGWLACATGGAPGGFAGFVLSPVLAPDAVTLVWTVLALLIFADNVEDTLGPGLHAAFLTGAGWVGAIARAAADTPGEHPFLGRFALAMPYSGAAAAATACAVAYALLFPLHRINFFHVFTSRRRSIFSMFDSARTHSSEFQVSAVTGFFLWGLGVLAGAFTGRAVAGDLAGLVFGAGAGAAAGLWMRASRPRTALPREFELPSAGGPPLVADAPPLALPEKALPAPEPFAVGGWAVLRETDELHDVGNLGRIAARYMGVPVADATRRIRQTRGVIARGMVKANAEALAGELGKSGVAAFAVDEEGSGGLPEVRYVRSCTCGPEGLEFETPEGEKGLARWGEIGVIAAARIDEEDEHVSLGSGGEDVFSPAGGMPTTVRRVTSTTFVDAVLLRPPSRIRLASREGSSAAGMRAFAAAILRDRGAVPVNKGVAVIAGRGQWGYLAFPAARAFEEHLWWLVQVIRRRAAPVREAPRAGSGRVADYLE